MIEVTLEDSETKDAKRESPSSPGKSYARMIPFHRT